MPLRHSRDVQKQGPPNDTQMQRVFLHYGGPAPAGSGFLHWQCTVNILVQPSSYWSLENLFKLEKVRSSGGCRVQKPSIFRLQIPMLEFHAVHEIPPVWRMNFWGNLWLSHVIPISVDEIQKNITHFWMLVIPQTGWRRLHQVLPPLDWGLAQKALLLRGSEPAMKRCGSWGSNKYTKLVIVGIKPSIFRRFMILTRWRYGIWLIL